MTLSVLNHNFKYETENVIRIFFPLEKINITDSMPADDDDFAITSVNGDCVFCEVKINGKSKSEKRKITNTAEKDTELLIAQTLFDILVALTNYKPSWGVLTGVRPSKLMRSLIKSSGEKSACEHFKNNLFVSDSKTKLALTVAKAEDEIINLSQNNSYSLYVSIPFCPTRCSYCSFVSHSVAQAKKLMPDYIKLLCKELEITANIADELGLKLETIYFGGGTPTSLSENDLKSVTDAVGKHFKTENAREYTIEAGRPDTITPEKLKIMKNAGVTRISINPQTFNGDVLKNIGRDHTPEMILNAFDSARSEGFDNINMDFIAGLPGDTYESFCASIDKAVNLEPENITVHTLALKRASSIVTSDKTGSLENDTSKMLAYSGEKLYNSGYVPYYMYRQSKSIGNNENVGWSKKGKECLYNVYMMEEIHTVLAAGGGAVTKLKSPNENLIERIFNFKYPYEYISRFDEQIERKTKIRDFYLKLK